MESSRAPHREHLPFMIISIVAVVLVAAGGVWLGRLHSSTGVWNPVVAHDIQTMERVSMRADKAAGPGWSIPLHTQGDDSADALERAEASRTQLLRAHRAQAQYADRLVKSMRQATPPARFAAFWKAHIAGIQAEGDYWNAVADADGALQLTRSSTGTPAPTATPTGAAATPSNTATDEITRCVPTAQLAAVAAARTDVIAASNHASDLMRAAVGTHASISLGRISTKAFRDYRTMKAC